MVAVNYYEPAFQEDLNVGVGTGTKRNPAGGSLPGTQIGIHTLALGQAAVPDTWAPGTLTALGTTTHDVTVTGAALGDFAHVSFDNATNNALGGAILSAYVSQANIVKCVLFNPTQSSLTITSGTVRVLVLKSR
jgi:hypothetical protein